MRKSTRIVNRFLALFFVVLVSIESFAAVVSDNDGSAFITKAEFDSLKNSFQSKTLKKLTVQVRTKTREYRIPHTFPSRSHTIRSSVP